MASLRLICQLHSWDGGNDIQVKLDSDDWYKALHNMICENENVPGWVVQACKIFSPDNYDDEIWFRRIYPTEEQFSTIFRHMADHGNDAKFMMKVTFGDDLNRLLEKDGMHTFYRYRLIEVKPIVE